MGGRGALCALTPGSNLEGPAEREAGRGVESVVWFLEVERREAREVRFGDRLQGLSR